VIKTKSCAALHWRVIRDLQHDKGILEVKLVSVPSDTALGGLKVDSFFEIYTESYGDRPIVIQGAGAGSAVTARGVFGDILRFLIKGKKVVFSSLYSIKSVQEIIKIR
jgi:homoserine dehydrogenase